MLPMSSPPRFISILLACILLMTTGFSQAEVPSQVIVKFRENTGLEAGLVSAREMTINLPAGNPVSLKRVRAMTGGAQVLSLGAGVSKEEVADILAALSRNPSVAYAEQDLLMRVQFAPNDPLYADQWHYYEMVGGINLPTAWDLSQGDGVVVAVIDTGYRPHADLVDNILPGYDFISTALIGNDGDGRDDNPIDPGDGVSAGGCGFGFPLENVDSTWHGTHVAGTVAAVTDNGLGVAGVASNAKILPVRVLGRCGGFVSDIVDGMRWAAGLVVAGVPNNPNPAKVLNQSLSSVLPSACPISYLNAIADVRAAGAVVVVAAGNASGDADAYTPGNCAGAFTVAATTRAGGKASYSNSGIAVDVAAPGGSSSGDSTEFNGVLSTSNEGALQPGTDNYLYYQGTSMATPHVAGTAALLLGINNLLTPLEIETALKETARPFPENCSGCGFGIVDATQASLLINGDIAPQDKVDLIIELTGDDGRFHWTNFFAGQGSIRYLATVTNAGPKIASTTVMTHVYPADITVASIETLDGVCSADGLSCDFGSLAVGASVEVAIEVIAVGSQKRNFTATVSNDVLEINPGDNQETKRFGGAVLWLLILMGGIGLMREKKRGCVSY